MSSLDIHHHRLHQGSVVHVWLNRPELRNAFNDSTIAELTRTFGQLGADPGVRAIILGAHGPAFSAGGDLNWMRAMADYSWDENHADAARLADMLWTIARCPVPVIARVQGDCFGGGVGLVAACDMAVASDNAGFCLSEVKLGLIPATIGPYVVRAIGERAARRYFLTAERFSAAQAAALGLVHEVCTAEALDEVVDRLAQAIVANGPQAVRASKQLVADIAGHPITAQLRDQTARTIANIRASDEGRAGLQAFLSKTPAPWLRKTDTARGD
ncbi:MAG: enoyl-CoA hydratase/isomerase family protein [Burkholderiales bacterium]|nr:enoyl-CoA hydratase/isomerase family protein [Burkholderiales bacterium]